MTVLTFENFKQLSSELAFDLIEKLNGEVGIDAEFGASNQSPSRYVNITIADDDGEVVEEFKIRFSDHADRHGSDITVRFDHLIETIEDEGEYVATTIEGYRYEALIEEAFSAARALIASAR